MLIKFVDLSPIHKPLKPKFQEAFTQIVTDDDYVGGFHVDLFETNFAKYLGVSNCISCGNGTDALELALWALDISDGDEVIVPVHSWISSVSAIVSNGAKPIFVDCNYDDFTIDINKIESKITSKTKAIIAVHLYGHPADMEKLTQISTEYNIRIIEDTAQAHGSSCNDKKSGTIGDVGCFSFYPSKNLGCLGDGGCIVTNNDEIATKIRYYKNCGQKAKNIHKFWGRNSRLDSIQAAVLNIKLPYLDKWNQQRRLIASYYNQNLSKEKFKLPIEKPYAYHVYHIYCVRTKSRESVIKRLNKEKIQFGSHYPTLLSNLSISPATKIKEHENYCKELISLPLYVGIPIDHLQRIVHVLNSVG